MKTKYAKLIVKDSSGDIIQLLPETKCDTIINQNSQYPVSNSAVANALDSIGSDFVHLTGNESISGQKTFAQGPYETAVAMSASAVNLSLGSVFTKTVSANTTFSITNAPSGKASRFTLILENAGSYSITWPSSILWPKNTAPSLSASGKDVLHFYTADGTTWHGSMDTSPSSIKEIGVVNSEPSSVNTASLDNESIIFWNAGSSNALSENATPVFTTGNQTILGVKKFASGLFGGTKAMTSNEVSFDCSAATSFTKTVTSNTTFSFSNVPEDTTCCITVILTNGGNYTVAWPSSVKWSENATPTLTQNGTDVLTFITCTGGNVWYGTTTCIGITA